MRSSLLLGMCLVGLMSSGFFLLDELSAQRPPDEIVVEQVHANLIRIQFNGEWEEFPLMPLADHLCQSNNRLFEKYCGDEVLAPGDR